MAIAFIILGSLLLIAGLTFALKSIKPMYFNVIAGIIILIGSFFGLFGKQLQDKNSSEKSDKILKSSESTEQKVGELRMQNLELTKKADVLKEKAELQAQTIDKLREENTHLYMKLSDANKEIYGNLTGGDSYCKMSIGNINSENDLGTLIFYVEGKNPLNRIQARIVDMNEFNPDKVTIDDLTKNVIEIGTLDPDKAFMTDLKYKMDKSKGVNLNVFFGANNGFTTQLIRMRFAYGKWVTSEKILRYKDGKELFVKIDPDYPIKDKMQIFK